jgi:transglutaminase-like putative cysteine protease
VTLVGRVRENRAVEAVDWPRAMALFAVLATLGAALQVMYHFIDVVGLPLAFLAIVAISLVAATALARVLPAWTAVVVAVVLLALGLGWYLTQITGNPPWVALFADALSLFGGRSLLRISNVRAWVLGVTPGPVFLTWYFALRRWYTPAVAVAGGTLAFFVLTGDADVVTTLTGVVAGAAALGLGDFERRDEPIARAETVLVVAAVMIVVPSAISVVPATAGAAGPLAPGLDRAATIEANLMNAEEDLAIQGDISLSPQVRFTVSSDEGNYWRVGSYDRYTGDGWVRTGGTSEYRHGRLGSPPGPSRTVDQTFRVETQSNVAPSAWKPVRVGGLPDASVRNDGSVVPGETLEEGDSYRVRSEVSDASPRQLDRAGTEYPDGLQSRYTQLPDSTPDRVGDRTARLTADADTPYQRARVVEQWLQNNREYSLNVDRPRGDVADAFLFEMDAGYCTYYATTMVTMLRSQDVPARFVTGYTDGERVDEDRRVVRGLNAHAWVEVYFPEYGWVQFDPTPGGPREAVREQNLQQARDNEETAVDTTETGGTGEWTPSETQTPEPLTTAAEGSSNVSADADSGPVESPTLPAGIITQDLPGVNATGANATGTGEGAATDGPLPRMPTRQQFALVLVAALGAAVGVRRSGVPERAYRALWLRYQPRADPATDVERAFQRLQHYLGENHYRPRWDDETVREYVDAIDADPRARRVAAIRERARYRGDVSEADADEAVRLVNELVR